MDRLHLAIGASFTADPLDGFAPFWAQTLGVRVECSLTLAAQLFQSLLSADDTCRGDVSAVRSLLIRWSDFGGDAADAAQEIVAAVNAARVPYTLFICPERNENAAAPTFEQLRASLHPRCNVVDVAEVFEKYRVANVFDRHGDDAASVPYSQEAYAALCAELVRRAYAERRAPVKLIAVDCDNTIWRGVVGEDGASGVVIDSAAAAMQHRLRRLSDAGVAIALLSKNEDSDVTAVFSEHPDMALTLDHISARGVNWRDKSENLAAIAQQFAVSQDAIVFLDDNPVEIAAMRAQMHGVASVQVTRDPRFADHLWVLDSAATTNEDRTRRQMVRDDAVRREEATAAPTLKAFIDGLELKVEIAPACDSVLARLAQLTQRTNQFNTALLRFTEGELRLWADGADRHLLSVSARDRFGDYGVVGVIGLERRNGRYCVSLFSLSCRALGRGVEHQMAAYIGAFVAREAGHEVSFDLTYGPRNGPAVSFLQEILGRDPIEGANVLNAQALSAVRYHPAARPVIQRSSKKSDPLGVSTTTPDWTYIATNLSSGRAILDCATAHRRAERKLSTPFIAPAGGLERDIAKIWEDVLAVSPVGAQDAFTALGGKSIHLVQVHSRLIDLLRQPIDLTLLFECSTPAQLARRIGDIQSDARSTIRIRANAMANARVGRMKHARETLETLR